MGIMLSIFFFAFCVSISMLRAWVIADKIKEEEEEE